MDIVPKELFRFKLRVLFLCFEVKSLYNYIVSITIVIVLVHEFVDEISRSKSVT